MTETFEIKGRFEELQERYREYLPKADPALIYDLLLRQLENPSVAPMYMVEVFTRPGLDPEKGREYIMRKTGMSAAIYDDGTHYVTNQKLTLEMLKEISDSEDVLEVTGEYTGGLGGYGASHEHRRHDEPRKLLAAPRTPARQDPPPVSAEQPRSKKGGYSLAIYTAIGIVGAIVLAGFIVSGGTVPNANAPSVSPTGEPGALHGYVAGPAGLPAIGASVVAAEQASGHTVSEFVSVTGQYYMDLPAGEYVVMVAYPDGTNRVVDRFVVERGTSHELDFSY